MQKFPKIEGLVAKPALDHVDDNKPTQQSLENALKVCTKMISPEPTYIYPISPFRLRKRRKLRFSKISKARMFPTGCKVPFLWNTVTAVWLLIFFTSRQPGHVQRGKRSPERIAEGQCDEKEFWSLQSSAVPPRIPSSSKQAF